MPRQRRGRSATDVTCLFIHGRVAMGHNSPPGVFSQIVAQPPPTTSPVVFRHLSAFSGLSQRPASNQASFPLNKPTFTNDHTQEHAGGCRQPGEAALHCVRRRHSGRALFERAGDCVLLRGAFSRQIARDNRRKVGTSCSARDSREISE